MNARDLLDLAWLGIRARRTRAALSALGISVGIATLVVVVGIPASGRQALLDEISALGTNLLRVDPGQQSSGPAMAPEAAAMARRIGPVSQVSDVANTGATVRRSDRLPADDGSGLTVLAARPDLLATVHGRVASGAFLTGATERFPGVVLGHEAAARLGITGAGPPGVQVMVGRSRFPVTGVLEPVRLAPDLDRSVLVGWTAARERLGFDGRPTVLYLRVDERALDDVRAVLPATVAPQRPAAVRVSRPSDALAAKRLAEHSFSGLFVGLAGIALLVGGIGVANTMVVSVLERRREIGLRRALGATRGHVRAQFLTESAMLSGLGGLAGTAAGAIATVGYCAVQGWPPVVPWEAVAGGLLGALAVGVAAGAHPAVRASRLPPTEALSAG